MENFYNEMYNWIPKGVLLVPLFYVSKKLVQKIHEEIMTSLSKLHSELLLVNDKLERFDEKINDISIKVNSSVTIDRYISDMERIKEETRTLRERIMVLEAIR